MLTAPEAVTRLKLLSEWETYKWKLPFAGRTTLQCGIGECPVNRAVLIRKRAVAGPARRQLISDTRGKSRTATASGVRLAIGPNIITDVRRVDPHCNARRRYLRSANDCGC